MVVGCAPSSARHPGRAARQADTRSPVAPLDRKALCALYLEVDPVALLGGKQAAFIGQRCPRRLGKAFLLVGRCDTLPIRDGPAAVTAACASLPEMGRLAPVWGAHFRDRDEQREGGAAACAAACTASWQVSRLGASPSSSGRRA